MFNKNNLKKNIVACSITILLCIILLIWVMRLWNNDLGIPIGYSGDGLFYGVMIKGMIDNGWYLNNKYLAAPVGLHLHYDFSLGADSLHYLFIKFISLFSSNWAVIKNIFIFLTFPLAALSSLLVLRILSLSYACAIVGSLLFTFLPYHFIRAPGHTFLASYYAVPLAILLALWVYSKDPPLLKFNKKSVACIIICLLLSSSGMYYAFFACFFIIVAAISNRSTTKNYRKLISAGLLVIIICGGVLINISPSLYRRHKHKEDKLAFIRKPAAAEIYGLKISQLIFPINGHRLSSLEKLKNRYNLSAPLVNENYTTSLGIIGSLGFLLLLFRIIGCNKKLFSNEQGSELMSKLAILNISAILLATVGGFSSVFSYTILPIINAYNRISIFIAFFSLTAFFLFLESFFKKCSKKRLSTGIQIVILIIGVLDQTTTYYGTRHASKERYVNDAEFIQKLETILPANAMVFQLPYVPFPEYPSVYKMPDYEHFIAYLHSKTLRWSYGVLKGSQEDRWQKEVSSKPVNEFLEEISTKGFSGIYLNRSGYVDQGALIEAKLSLLLNIKPQVSSDNRLVFFDISGYNETHPSHQSLKDF